MPLEAFLPRTFNQNCARLRVLDALDERVLLLAEHVLEDVVGVAEGGLADALDVVDRESAARAGYTSAARQDQNSEILLSHARSREERRRGAKIEERAALRK